MLSPGFHELRPPADGGFDQRGLHGGNFTWLGQRLFATGTLSGITNAGTHRKPVFDPACQECHQPTFMEAASAASSGGPLPTRR